MDPLISERSEHDLTMLSIRPPFRACRPVVPLDPKTWTESADIRCPHGIVSYAKLWWLDLHHIDRRPRLARHLDDLIHCRDVAVDDWVHCAEPAKPHRD